MSKQPYAVRRVPGHPYPKNAQGQVYIHRLVVESAVGKYLHPRHHVHHVNEDTRDNRGCNLVVCEDNFYHRLLHRRMKALGACGNPSYRPCKACKRHDDVANMVMTMDLERNSENYIHVECRRLDAKSRHHRRAAMDVDYVDKRRREGRITAAKARAKRKLRESS